MRPTARSRATAYAIMCASGAKEPVYHEMLLRSPARATDVQGLLRSLDLSLLCVGSVPTRSGTPSTTITDPTDISQIICEQAS